MDGDLGQAAELTREIFDVGARPAVDLWWIFTGEQCNLQSARHDLRLPIPSHKMSSSTRSRQTRVLIVAARASDDLLGAMGPRRWDRGINALVPTALIAAIVAYAFPFIVSGHGQYPVDIDSGLSAFFIGFVVLTTAPLDPFFEAFSLPLIAAFVGLMYQRRRGWIGSLAPLVCSVVGLTLLGSAYFWDKQDHLAYGYFVAEASLLITAVASAGRLIRLRRNRAMWDAKDEPRFMPAASASQELLSRYPKNW
jgi:hypothetical protein